MNDNDYIELTEKVNNNIVCIEKSLVFNPSFYDYVIDPIMKYHTRIEDFFIPYGIYECKNRFSVYIPEEYSLDIDVFVVKSTTSNLPACLSEFELIDVDIEEFVKSKERIKTEWR